MVLSAVPSPCVRVEICHHCHSSTWPEHLLSPFGDPLCARPIVTVLSRKLTTMLYCQVFWEIIDLHLSELESSSFLSSSSFIFGKLLLWLTLTLLWVERWMDGVSVRFVTLPDEPRVCDGGAMPESPGPPVPQPPSPFTKGLAICCVSGWKPVLSLTLPHTSPLKYWGFNESATRLFN